MVVGGLVSPPAPTSGAVVNRASGSAAIACRKRINVSKVFQAMLELANSPRVLARLRNADSMQQLRVHDAAH
jgi:hypothetical protein